MSIPQALDPVAAVKAAFPEAVHEVVEYAGDTTIVLKPENLVTVARYLRDTPGLVYNFLSDISDVDYWEPGGIWQRPGRYGLTYHLLSMLYRRRLTLKVYLQEEDPSVESVISIWPAANWLEREIMDLMGIDFKGNPDKRRLMMPEDWQGHPHRRDYPLGYEQVMFSFNVEEIMRHKPKASE